VSPPRAFSEPILDWFEEGDTLATRPELAPYEPFRRVDWRLKAATIAASLFAVVATAWLLS
jgi:hypothetical protein